MAQREPWRAPRAVAALLALLTLAVPATADARLGDRTLKVGSRGTDVKQLQRLLTQAGYRTTADGTYGRGTAKVVKRFERAERRRADGKVQPADARLIRRRAQEASAGETGARQPGAGAQAAPTGGQAYDGAAGNPTATARLSADGRTAIAPDGAPPEVKAAIDAANRITTKPYRYGGGHGDFEDSGYDCSGAVSYALNGAGLLERPLDSSGFMSWGAAGPGRWITVYAHGGHAYVVIAGLRFDTSGSGEKGPRWRKEARSPRGFTARHPDGL